MIRAMTFAGRAVLAALPFAIVLVLSGCGVPGSTYADLQGDREARDELPRLSDDAYEAVDVESSRFVGEHEGASLWLAEGSEVSHICLVVVPESGAWSVGCGVGAVRSDGAGGSFGVIADGQLAPKGATAISENVYAG